jgi:hypothetical protein
MKSLLALALALGIVGAAPAQKRPTAVVHHPIACNAGAQAAFDRGLLDYYAYNPEAAEHAFYTAVDLDKNCAMAWWGVAQSNAPNLNVPATDDRDAQAQQAIKSAKSLERYATPEDAAFIDAASALFSVDMTAAHEPQLIAYRDALKAIADKYPDDPDAAALYSEAGLYAFVGGSWPRRDQMTDAQRASFMAQGAALLPYFETSIARFPKHVGLLHYFIHAAQFADDSKAAVAAALQLGAFALPAEDSHLTHMPGHTFFDIGMYANALDVGTRSVAMDAADFACCHPGYYSSTRYYHGHNVDFVLYAMTQTGHLDDAIAIARGFDRHGFLARQLVAAGRWSDVVALPKNPAEGPPGDYARAIAYAHLGDAANARAAIGALPATKSPGVAAFYDAMRQTVEGEIAVAAQDDAKALPLLQAASASLAAGLKLESTEIPLLYFYSPDLALARVAERLGKNDVARTALQAELLASPQSPTALAMLAKLGST